jgi:predicted transcriptional regulator
MAPVQVKILEILKNSNELSLNELVHRVQEGSSTTTTEVRAALLPLISSENVDLTPDRKLRLKP